MQEMGHNCWAEAGDASGSHGTRESGQKISILQSALELMHNLLRQVSEVVRKALQVIL